MTPPDIKTIQLSDTIPSQSGNSGGTAYTKGTYATIFQTDGGDYGYCYHGVGEGGNAFESDDIEGFTTSAEAEADARDNYRA